MKDDVTKSPNSPSILDLTNERGQRKSLLLLCRAKRKSRLACNGCPKGGVVILNIFLEQSRRDKTHEVLITPHKRRRSAMWGFTTADLQQRLGETQQLNDYHKNQNNEKNPPVNSRMHAVSHHIRSTPKDHHFSEQICQNRYGFDFSRYIYPEKLLRGHRL